jgi:hypothetical protein
MSQQTVEEHMPRVMRTSAAERTVPMPEVTTAVVTGRLGEPQTEADLDEAVARVRQHRKAFEVSGWELGHELARIADANLWKLRTDGEGGPLYKSWGDFVRRELQMSVEGARQAIRIAGRCSREEVALLGATKAALVLQAPPEDQEAIKAAAQGQTKREVEQAVRHANAAKRTPAQQEKQKERQASQRKKIEALRLKPTKDESTLFVVVGKTHDLPLYADAKSRVGKTLPNGAHAFLDLGNDTRWTFQLVRTTSSWKLRVTAKRDA